MNIKCDDKCFCIDGYVRAFGPNGPCIPVKTCPVVCADPNAEYSCKSPTCETTCRTIGQPCDDGSKECKDRCYCKKGYVRDDNEDCVLLESCIIPSKILLSLD